MANSYKIVEITPDGKYEFIENSVPPTDDLSYKEKMMQSVLRDDSSVENRERCTHLFSDILSFETRLSQILDEEVASHRIVPFSQFFKTVSCALGCDIPIPALHLATSKVVIAHSVEYIPFIALSRLSVAEELSCLAHKELTRQWCVSASVLAAAIGCEMSPDTDLIEALNVILGRRGVFSVGVCPIIPEDKTEEFMQIEHLFAEEPSGLMDVALWGSTESEDTKTYHYYGKDYMDFTDRLYFNEQSVALLYAMTASLLENVYRCSVLWAAKRFSRSLGERELAVFLFTSDKLEFTDFITMQPGPALDIRAIKARYGMSRDDEGMLVLAQVDNAMSKIARRIADDISSQLDAKQNQGKTDTEK